MSNSKTTPACQIQLPRRSHPTLADVRSLAVALGKGNEDAEANARAMSASEWALDLEWTYREQDQLGLLESERLALEDRVRERNRAIWGEFSATD